MLAKRPVTVALVAVTCVLIMVATGVGIAAEASPPISAAT